MSNKPVCRVGDQCEGTCKASGPGHPRHFIGTWTSGSSTLKDLGANVIRVGDVGVTDCFHDIQATSGSSIGSNSGLAIHRVGDTVTITNPGGGDGASTTGSSVSVMAD